MYSLEDLFKTIANMQDELNTYVNGEEWVSGVTNKGKDIDWETCIMVEAGELMDSVAWKHWKGINDATDTDNVRIEIVDILHFMLSLTIEHTHNNITMYEVGTNYVTKAGELATAYIQNLDENVAEEILPQPDDTIYRVVAKKLVANVLNGNLTEAWGAFGMLSYTAFNSPIDIFELYISKYMLNKFRYDHGYMEGTYIKDWEGEEDNSYMNTIRSSADILTEEGRTEIYNLLESRYAEINNK